VAAEGAEEPERVNWPEEEPVGEQQSITFLPGTIDRLAREHCRIDIRAFKPLVPVAVVIEDASFQIFVPEGRTTIDTEPVKAKGVQLESRGETEALQDVLFGFSR